MTDKEKTIKRALKILASEPEGSVYYKTRLANNESEMTYEYASQICEIEKLKNNQEELNYLLDRTSFQTSITIAKYINLLDLAGYVYSNGKDTPEFDEKVKQLNEFITSRIVKRPEHSGIKKILGIKRTTFREVSREDLRKSNKSYRQLKDQRAQEYSSIETYMSDILDDRNK